MADEPLDEIDTDEDDVEVSKTATDIADKIMGQALPGACQTVVNLSAHADSERTRMTASKIVIDYNLKRAADGHKDDGDYWENFMGDIMNSPKGEKAQKDSAKKSSGKKS